MPFLTQEQANELLRKRQQELSAASQTVPQNEYKGIVSTVDQGARNLLNILATPFRKGSGIGQNIAADLTQNETILNLLNALPGKKISPTTRKELAKKREQVGGATGAIGKATALTPEEQQQFENNPLLFSGKTLAGQGAYFVPGGSGVVGKTLAGGASGALAGFGASKEGEELGATLVGGGIGAGTGLAFGLAGKALNKIRADRAAKATENLGKNAPKYQGKSLSKDPFFTANQNELRQTAESIGIKNNTGSGTQMELINKAWNDSTESLDEILAGAKPVEKNTILDLLMKNYQNSNIEEATPAQRRAVDMILEKLVAAGDDPVALNALKSEAKRELTNAFDKNMAGLSQRQEVWNLVYKTTKEALDTVSTEVRNINNYQHRLFNLAAEVAPQAQKVSPAQITIPFVKPGINLPISNEAVAMSGSRVANQIARPFKAVGRGVGNVAAATQAVPQQIPVALQNILAAGGASSLVSPQQQSVQEPVVNNAVGVTQPTTQPTTQTQQTGQIPLEMVMMAQLTLPKKEADRITAMYELQQKNQRKPLSATTENRVQLAESGLRALKELKTILRKDPYKVFAAAVPGKIGARDYDSAAFRAVEGLLRARSGAAVPEIEVRRYMNANLPKVGDTDDNIKFKISAFEKDLQAVANSGQTGTSDFDQLLQTLSAQGVPLQ